jgi:hypothetical protein
MHLSSQADCAPLLQPCTLYDNTKPPEQQLFTAAAALWSLTGDMQYRIDADSFLKKSDVFVFFGNWCAIASGMVSSD